MLQPTRMFASRMAIDLNLYQTLVDHGSPMTAEQLAAPVKASPQLVNRIARKLANARMIDETGPGTYAPNKLTKILTVPKYYEGTRFW